MELDGRAAIVTGAGTGLGEVYAKALAREGARVAVVDRNGAAAASVAAQISAEGGHAEAITCDVSRDADVEAMANRVAAAFGRLDVLVNNAGLARGRWSLCIDLTSAEWHEILAVNTVGPVICARACRALMAASGGGAIVNQSSMSAYGTRGAYGASKLALNSVTATLAHELAGDGIRVNAIAPGMMSGRVPQERIDSVFAMQALKRMGTPEDLVGTLLFLCSARSSFITGQTILVDGGAVIRP
jgi:NAD(P)-dependent dehydrogenase (short-subunit alcohol dehydrogenase family)